MSEGSNSTEALADWWLSGDTPRRGCTQRRVVSLRVDNIPSTDRRNPNRGAAKLCVRRGIQKVTDRRFWDYRRWYRRPEEAVPGATRVWTQGGFQPQCQLTAPYLPAVRGRRTEGGTIAGTDSSSCSCRNARWGSHYYWTGSHVVLTNRYRTYWRRLRFVQWSGSSRWGFLYLLFDVFSIHVSVVWCILLIIICSSRRFRSPHLHRHSPSKASCKGGHTERRRETRAHSATSSGEEQRSNNKSHYPRWKSTSAICHLYIYYKRENLVWKNI